MSTAARLGIIAAAVIVIAGVITGIVVAFSPSAEPFTPSPGSLATNAAEERLLLMHEAYGTLKPGASNYDDMQRAILSGARTLCDQLDREVMTARMWTAIAERQGVPDANVVTNFAISSLCPQHQDDK